MKFSFLIPTLQEQAWIPGCISALGASCAAVGADFEVIVCDGGSTDLTRTISEDLGVRVVNSAIGRASQVNCGFEKSVGDVIVMLHADCLVTPDLLRAMQAALSEGACGGWSQIDILPGKADPNLLSLMSWGINLRTRHLHTATADQSIFCTRAAFEAIGGVPNLPLMEGWEFSRRVQEYGDTATLPASLRISGRRWEKGGVVRTMLKMYATRLGYLCGVEMDELVDFWEH